MYAWMIWVREGFRKQVKIGIRKVQEVMFEEMEEDSKK